MKLKMDNGQLTIMHMTDLLNNAIRNIDVLHFLMTFYKENFSIKMAMTKRMVVIITPLPDLNRLVLTKNIKGIRLEKTARLIT